MSMTKIGREAGRVVIIRATWGGKQNFLGARWVERIVESSPARIRKHLALRFLSLSPHYFYAHDIYSEAERNRRSRHELVEALVAPYLTRAAHVLDYGCGPGYMACAVADRVDHVDAVDVSRGVLACAKALNQRPNINYLTPSEFGLRPEQVDVAYSFAVVQHLTGDALVSVLNLIASKMRRDGRLILHFASPDSNGWRTEAECVSGRSIVGRAKLRYGLNCFGRTAHDMAELVAENGFTDVTVRPLAGSLKVMDEDDITKQHLLTARRE